VARHKEFINELRRTAAPNLQLDSSTTTAPGRTPKAQRFSSTDEVDLTYPRRAGPGAHLPPAADSLICLR